jgi:hypothetical protein
MRTVGILGSMSWESSVEYERSMTEDVRRRLGPRHSPDMLIRSYDFAQIEAGDRGAGDLVLPRTPEATPPQSRRNCRTAAGDWSWARLMDVRLRSRSISCRAVVASA